MNTAGGDEVPPWAVKVREQGQQAVECGVRARVQLGLEGIVSKRRDSIYRPGRSRMWLKVKNPASAAMQRVWEEDRL